MDNRSRTAEHQHIVPNPSGSLAHANRALRVLSECNSALIRARDEDTLLQDMCRIVVDSGGYHMAWVGYAERDEAKRIRPVAQAGHEEGYLDTLNLTWADRERGHDPMGTAIRTGAPLIARNIPADPDSVVFRERALQRGYTASIGLPLKNDGQILGALAIYAAEPAAFDDREVELLTKLAENLAYGIVALRNRAELDRHRNQLEEILRERNEEYGMVLRTAMDGFWMVDIRGRFLEVNDAYCELIGYTHNELLAMSISDIEAAESAEETAAHIQTIMCTGSGRFITRHRRKNGVVLDVEVSTNYLPLHGGRFFVFVRDVTERKRMEEALKDSKRWVDEELAKRSAELDVGKQYLRRVVTAIEQAPVSVVITDAEGRIEYVNPAFTQITGYAPEEALGQNPRLLKSARQDPEKYRDLWTRLLAGAHWHSELINQRKDGSHYTQDMTVAPVRDTNDNISHFVSVAVDVTPRKRAEQAAIDALVYNRLLIEASPIGILTYKATGSAVSSNEAAAQLTGATVEQLKAQNFREIESWKTSGLLNLAEQALSANSVAEADVHVVTTFGKERWLSVRFVPFTHNSEQHLLGLFSDMTRRQRAEESFHESEARFRGLVEQSMVGIYQIDGEKVLYQNPRADEIFGYEPGELVGVSVKTLVADEDWPAVEREIRRLVSGEIPVVKLDFRGRRKDGQEVIVGAQGVLTHTGGRPTIIGVLQDVTEKLRAEEQIQRYFAQLENAFMGAVEVAITLSEMRDPYTAAHERRVAEIAVAIGTELGFDKRRQEGLRVAGYLHDVGKITIPSEILSKPGKLSAAEFALVRGHSQASYDILKIVDFPWPVAQVALQHHERIDGSGYPQGLKGEEIVFEARIMAVADVVEAMASHRPYRPGLGIDKALAEIERGRGTAYDPVVADACLRLFREKGYLLSNFLHFSDDVTRYGFSVAI